ncbi:MAG: hypothetical protein ACN4EP_01855 [Sediminibacterium sp.]|nr:hypothetical protein [uncultured Sediminibacterium sp.]
MSRTIFVWLLFCTTTFSASAHRSHFNLSDYKKKPGAIGTVKKSEQTIIDAYWKAFQDWDAKRGCKENEVVLTEAVSPVAFDPMPKHIFINVMVGSNDLASNTTAASFVQKSGKGTLNLNTKITRHILSVPRKLKCNYPHIGKFANIYLGFNTHVWKVNSYAHINRITTL